MNLCTSTLTGSQDKTQQYLKKYEYISNTIRLNLQCLASIKKLPGTHMMHNEEKNESTETDLAMTHGIIRY